VDEQSANIVGRETSDNRINHQKESIGFYASRQMIMEMKGFKQLLVREKEGSYFWTLLQGFVDVGDITSI
jgi:hypothetical protein